MKRRTKIIIFIVVIVAILLPIYLLSAVNKKIEERDNSTINMQKNAVTDKTENKIKNTSTNSISEANNTTANITTTENNETKETTENNTTDNTTTNNNLNSNTEEVSVNNPEEKAIQIAKKDWGEDDSVYFSYDGIDGGTGNYIIGVRDRENTYIKCWYYVNVKLGTFTVKR